MDARQRDDEIIRRWRAGGLYRFTPDLTQRTFSAVIPAPNPTGELHMGHALNLTIQDILCRWYRLTGREILWTGALDHGNFSTQVVVERAMAQRGLDPRQAEPAVRRREIDAWIAGITPRIAEQMRQLAALMDMDELASMADATNDRLLRSLFVELHEKGVVYEADAVTDFCPTCRTSVDKIDEIGVEVERVVHHLRWRDVDNPDLALVVSTSTPETIHADVALALAEGDPRSKELSGRELVTPLGNRVKVIACRGLPPDASGGVMRITPAHCRFSFKVARARGFEAARAYDERGVMLSGPWSGKSREEARAAVLSAARQSGALAGEERIKATVPACRKCGQPIEQAMSHQWFVAIEPLLAPTLELLGTGQLHIYPKHYESYCKMWLKQCQRALQSGSHHDDVADDWCVSRQIECGNRLPVHRCACGVMSVGVDARDCPTCGARMSESTDIIDLRLSDALWAYCANRRYTGDAAQLAAIGKDAVCVTGLDLLLYWIMPIAMLSARLGDPLPFRDVLIHPIVCDALGQKMSKSFGNVVVPTEILDEHGADCLRLTLLDGLDLRLDKMPFSKDNLEKSRQALEALKDASARIIARGGAAARRAASAEVEAACARIQSALEVYAFEALFPEVRQAIDRVVAAASDAPPDAAMAALRESLVLLHPFAPMTTESIWDTAFPDEGLLAAFTLADLAHPRSGRLPRSPG